MSYEFTDEPIVAYRSVAYGDCRHDPNGTIDHLMQTFTGIGVLPHYRSIAPWTGGSALEAQCVVYRMTEHTSPAEDCSCGFYTMPRLRTYMNHPIVIKVLLYGTVMDHGYYYRSTGYTFTDQAFISDRLAHAYCSLKRNFTVRDMAATLEEKGFNTTVRKIKQHRDSNRGGA